MASVTVALEGDCDVPVIRKLLAATGHELAIVQGLRGKTFLTANLMGYNNAARFSPWLVVRDLDHDAECAGELIAKLLPVPSAKMMLRIAVRETEAWLLADKASVAVFLSVAKSRVPTDPDGLEDPKQSLVNLARQSKKTAIRQDMVPPVGWSGVVGPAYMSRIEEFARDHWNPSEAAKSSDSLKRCFSRLLAWNP